MNEEVETFFLDAFTHPVTQEPYNIPPELKRASRRICQAFNIRGTCDPMWIANVIAYELGLGDGKSNFNKK